MTASVVKDEIFRFLRSSVPEVLCITGKWGVGKTYAWKRFLQEARAKSGGIALKRYAYVSLFGINTLEELKYAIFEATIKCEQIGEAPSFGTIRDTLNSAEGMTRKAAWTGRAIPIISDIFSAAMPAFFLTVRQQIICFDDLERKGEQLNASDVLGLASLLREEKHCKVAFLMNEDELPNNDRVKFDSFLEKVIDIRLRFRPTAIEAAGIALPAGTSSAELLFEHCVTLDITNIRTIKRAERHLARVVPELAEFDAKVTAQAAHSIALFVWAASDRQDAPGLEFIRKLSDFDLLFSEEVERRKKKKKLDDKEQAWNALLRRYKFTNLDSFDRVLLEGVENGYFDITRLKAAAGDTHQQALAEKHNAMMQQAWDLYHGSFDHNEEEVVAAVRDAFLSSVMYISVGHLDAVVGLLKDLDRPDLAKEALDTFIDRRKAERGIFNLDERVRPFGIRNEEIRTAFEAMHIEMELPSSPSEVLLSIARDHSHSEDDMLTLSSMTEDDFHKFFKRTHGDELHAAITAALKFEKYGNATNEMLAISQNARGALLRIAKESRLNARRVQKYGVEMELAYRYEPRGEDTRS